MTAPPDPNGNGAPSPDGAPSQNFEQLAGQLDKSSTETVSPPQARSRLELQIFVLARRCAISAPMASAIAPLIWGWRS
jgi:hypothetical protein